MPSIRVIRQTPAKEVIMQSWEYSSLRHTEQGLVYSIYRARRLTTTLVYQGEDTDDYNTVLASYIARLGLLGWEALQATFSSDGRENQHFKRSIHPGNHYLNFSNEDTKSKSPLF
jgi:hypothetical protein